MKTKTLALLFPAVRLVILEYSVSIIIPLPVSAIHYSPSATCIFNCRCFDIVLTKFRDSSVYAICSVQVHASISTIFSISASFMFRCVCVRVCVCVCVRVSVCITCVFNFLRWGGSEIAPWTPLQISISGFLSVQSRDDLDYVECVLHNIHLRCTARSCGISLQVDSSRCVMRRVCISWKSPSRPQSLFSRYCQWFLQSCRYATCPLCL